MRARASSLEDGISSRTVSAAEGHEAPEEPQPTGRVAVVRSSTLPRPIPGNGLAAWC